MSPVWILRKRPPPRILSARPSLSRFAVISCVLISLASGLSESSCYDGIQNGLETDVDCGGKACQPCATGRMCETITDCDALPKLTDSSVDVPVIECSAVDWGPHDSSSVCLDVRSISVPHGVPNFISLGLLLDGVKLSWCNSSLLHALRSTLAYHLDALGVIKSPLASLVLVDRVRESSDRISQVPRRPALTLPRIAQSGSISNQDLALFGCDTRRSVVSVALRVVLSRENANRGPALSALLNSNSIVSMLCSEISRVVSSFVPDRGPNECLLPSVIASISRRATLVHPIFASSHARAAQDIISQSATPSPSVAPSPNALVAAGSGSALVVQSGGTATSIIIVLSGFAAVAIALWTFLIARDMRAGPCCGVRSLCLATLCGVFPLTRPTPPNDTIVTSQRAVGYVKQNSALAAVLASSAQSNARLVHSADKGSSEIINTLNPIGASNALRTHTMSVSVLAVDTSLLVAEVPERLPVEDTSPLARHQSRRLQAAGASFRAQSFQPSPTDAEKSMVESDAYPV